MMIRKNPWRRETEEELQKKDYCKTQKMNKEGNALEVDSYSDCRYYNKGGGSKGRLAKQKTFKEGPGMGWKRLSELDAIKPL